jgi:hypothetical protein
MVGIAGMLWFFGWAFLLLKFPSQSFRVMTLGTRTASPKDLKVAKIVGYMGLFFGCVALVQTALDLVRWAIHASK